MEASSRAFFLSILVAFPITACRTHARASADPTPSNSAPVEPPAPPPAKSLVRYALFHGHLIDRREGKELRVFADARDLPQVVIGDRAYLSTSTGNTFAWDITDAESPWNQGGACSAMLPMDRGLLCGTFHRLVFYSASDGAPHDVARFTTEVRQIVASGDRVIVFYADRSVEAYDAKAWTLAGSLKPSSWSSPFVATTSGACTTEPSARTHVCLDPSAHAWRVTPYPISAGTFVDVRRLDHDLVVLSTFGATPASTIVARTDDFSVIASLPIEASAAIASDGTLEALFVAGKNPALFDAHGALLWGGPVDHVMHARAIALDDAIVAATYEPSTDGAILQSFDRRTGVRRWTADLALAPLAHSIYRTDVSLSEAFGRIELRGEESGQLYYELVDAKTGARVLATHDALW